MAVFGVNRDFRRFWRGGRVKAAGNRSVSFHLLSIISLDPAPRHPCFWKLLSGCLPRGTGVILQLFTRDKTMTDYQSDDSGLSENINKTNDKRPIKWNPRGRTPQGDPNPVDVYIGTRIKLRRQTLALSQEKLADLLGTTFQQVQKYERGMNRVSGSRMWDLCCILDVDPNYFYIGMPPEIREKSPRFQHLNPNWLNRNENDTVLQFIDPMQKAESIILVTAYEKIANRKLAKSLYNAMIHASFTVESKEQAPDDDNLAEEVKAGLLDEAKAAKKE